MYIFIITFCFGVIVELMYIQYSEIVYGIEKKLKVETLIVYSGMLNKGSSLDFIASFCNRQHYLCQWCTKELNKGTVVLKPDTGSCPFGHLYVNVVSLFRTKLLKETALMK